MAKFKLILNFHLLLNNLSIIIISIFNGKLGKSRFTLDWASNQSFSFKYRFSFNWISKKKANSLNG